MTDLASFDLLRKRLAAASQGVREKTDALNTLRLTRYGRIEPRLIARLSARTEHNCVARDVVRVHDNLLFGYQVFIGLKRETQLSDVFSVYRLSHSVEGHELNALPIEQSFLADSRFAADFKELVTYYKQAALEQLRVINDKLLLLFRTGGLVGDRKVFRFAIEQTGKVTYIDNRGERDHVLPPIYDFDWIQTTREQHVMGRYPHVNVLDTVFVETIGGDLTIKIENNTESGLGVFSESVDDKTQALGDADIAYADLRHQLLLRIKPYREAQARYFIYNKRLKSVVRVDEIGISCAQLPEDHGIVFSGGYALENGDHKRFADIGLDFAGFRLKRTLRAPNGEDVLYVFYEEQAGKYGLLPYNLIDRAIGQPLQAHGYARFADGQILLFVPETGEPSRMHAMQLWRTPFSDVEVAQTKTASTDLIGRLGNAALVRALAELRQVIQLASEARVYGEYERLLKLSAKCAESYSWLSEPEAQNLLPDLQALARTAKSALDAYADLESQKKKAAAKLSQAGIAVRELLSLVASKLWQKPDDFIDAIVRLKRQRGELNVLAEQPHIADTSVQALDQEIADELRRVGLRALKYFSDPAAFQALRAGLQTTSGELEKAHGTAQLKPLDVELDRLSESLNGLTELIASFNDADPQLRAQLLSETGKIFAEVNRIRAQLRTRREAYSKTEQGAEFQALMMALEQSVASSLARAQTPEVVEDAMAQALSQIEQLETRFGDQPEFQIELVNRREATLETFAAKRTQLAAVRDQRANALKSGVQRILEGLPRRLQGLKDGPEIHAFFASDSLIERARAQIDQLRQLSRGVDADELTGKLKSIRDGGMRDARDRAELGTDGSTLKLGQHVFSVAKKALELTFEVSNGQGYVALTGTDYRASTHSDQIARFEPVWQQHQICENDQVYRGEYLAYRLLQALAGDMSWGQVNTAALIAAKLDRAALQAVIAQEISGRIGEEMQAGIHDFDAALMLQALLSMQESAGALAMRAEARVLAQLWVSGMREEELADVRAASAGLNWLMTQAKAWQLPLRWQQQLSQLGAEYGLNDLAESAGRHLVETLGRDGTFPTDARALDLAALVETAIPRAVLQPVRDTRGNRAERIQLAMQWAHAIQPTADLALQLETAAVLLLPVARQRVNADMSITLSGLLGQHGNIRSGEINLLLPEFLFRVGQFCRRTQPLMREFLKFKTELLERQTQALKLEQLKAKPLAGFVRNRLIDEVYLPMIGNNLAKQIGTIDDKRADRSGMLLLISPPGYGKTTLMEYLADRLGMIFVRINGPTLGHEITSLDPAQTAERAAREELERLNLGLAMSNNVMLYLDDIQHLNPEFLQKFISLSDATRRVDAVLNGQAVTLDLRGKRFAIVMAGNPYTESGEVFRIPDMLANRADVYNLGDVLSGRDALFADSYIENALSAHPLTAGIADKGRAAVQAGIRIATGSDEAPPTELAQSADGIEILKRMVAVRTVLGKVNAAYVASSAQDDAFRVEPPFKLQGSYRNMIKLSAQLSPLMTERELADLIADHYRGEAQTLGARAEENLLKLAMLIGQPTPEQATRWQNLVDGFRSLQKQGGKGSDGSTKIANLLADIAQQIERQSSVADESAKSELKHAQLGVKEIASALKALATATQSKSNALVAPPELAATLEKLAKSYEETLVPLVSAMHHKMTLDHSIWEHVRMVRTDLDELVKRNKARAAKE